ncbi:hypothetical protein GDO86_015726 [Hymenochirus boettgeri]|uniref:Spectrin beta chain n=1 Tax=Hymenochirus boettgeri TaxID=247094 RepID=A0A8T2JZI2_9PIPI|nr:hypothetical protein GDO86_015726 [Hymenochirus boettgeri]
MTHVNPELDNMDVQTSPNNNNRWEKTEHPWDEPTATGKLFECSRIKALADERDAVQKKTFTKWMNSHLSKVPLRVNDLYSDLRDGYIITKLLEVLSGEQLPKPTRGRMRIHSLENVDKALQFLKEQRVHLENVGSHDIVDGNHRLTLGLIWTIILRFQIQVIRIETEDNRETRSAKDALLLWCQMKTAGYPEVNIQNFTTSWKDGLAFSALIHRHRPDVIDFSKLTKSNATYNLQQAFNTAEQQLGLTKLLDPEDVNMEHPDEKSIITYVVSFYHYFSKMKALAVEGKRIGKVLDQAIETEKDITRYEVLASELLDWIERTISIITNQKFANSLLGVQQQLQVFTAYCTTEKPCKFKEKGNLEVLLFSIQSKMRDEKRKIYVPTEGKTISDINKAWTRLEKAEHEREVALRNELIRQEKLELLSQRFDQKAAMREAWLTENQRLVSQDNFGYDLPAVEAAMKKHEAIEADISSYEERIQVVSDLAYEMESEGYYDICRISAQKDNIIRQWNLLNDLLSSRRRRLEQNLSLQKIFQEMVYMIDWMDEMQVALSSKDFGKHLLEVEDLLQKLCLLEADITAQTERVNSLNQAALKFTQFIDYQPCDPQVICNRVEHVKSCLEDLCQLAGKRRGELEESRQLWCFLQEVEEAEGWICEKEHILSVPQSYGKDLSSVLRLLSKHKIFVGELRGRHAMLQQTLQKGEQVLSKRRKGMSGLRQRMEDVRLKWCNLQQASENHQQKLQEASNFHQFNADTTELAGWLQDTYRLVSSDDFGHDEYSTQSLVKKHRTATEEIEKHKAAVLGLRQQLSELGAEYRDQVDLQITIVEVEQLYGEVAEVAALRSQWLQDALDVYKMFSEVNSCEVWIDEKEQWLMKMEIPQRLEEVEVVQHRFESLDQEMNSLMGRVLDVNQIVQQLLEGGHPSSSEVRACQDHLNSRWNRIVELVEQRKQQLSSILRLQNYFLECNEVKSQIREKRKAMETTQCGSGELGSVLFLQRKLSSMESALLALEPKLVQLQQDAEVLVTCHPTQAMEVLVHFEEISGEWEALKRTLQGCEDSLSVASKLQQFIQDLDNFLTWLVKTQTAVAAEELPSNLAEAERLLGLHASLKEEISRYEEDYNKIQAVSDLLSIEEADLPYLSLQQWLQKLEVGWNKLLQMWETRREVLVQSHVFHLFLKDVKQAEACLNTQIWSQRNTVLAQKWLQRLWDHLQLQHFIQDCSELDAWVNEKTLMARDSSRDLAQKPHKKWLKHQAFMAELAQNKGWLEKIEKKLEEIRQCWVELESSTQAKAQQLFQANKAGVVAQNYLDLGKRLYSLEEQLQPVNAAPDLSSVNTQIKKLEIMESQMEEWYKEVGELQAQIASLSLDVTSQEIVDEKQNEVETRIVRLIEPLKERRKILLASKEVHQVTRDLEDEILWVQERLPVATSKEHGSGLQAVQQLIKKTQNLRREIQVHTPRIDDILERAGAIASIRSPEAEGVRLGYESLREMWNLLREETERRQQLLDISYQVQQYYFDLGEVETWLSEHELLMMNDEKGKDEQSTLQLLKKHLMFEQKIENYEETIAQLSRQCRTLLDLGHPDSENISKRQSQIDRLYVSLKDLVDERKGQLEQQYWLFQLSHEVDELEQWIAEKEVVAGSPELGQDYEHVTLLQEKFTEFVTETNNIGQERISAVNLMVDELIDFGHSDAATIAEWKDGMNEAWADLLELMETRSQMLAASHELQKFFNDCKEVLSQVEEKKQRLPEVKAQESKLSAGSLQRILSSFEHDIQVLVTQVRQLQENAAQLRTVYAGENAAAIVTSEQEVVRSWKELLTACEDCRLQITNTSDRMKFLNLVRDLISWMDSIICQIGTGEKPRDVSSVEVLMNYHQGLKTDIEARNKRIADCVELGKSLVLNKRPSSDEIKQSLDRLMSKKKEMLEKWNKHWEWLQQIIEVHQFAQEAGVADAWLTAQEPIVKSPELGNSVDEVEQLIRRHEAFRKTAAAWEERFSSLRRLTTLEKVKAEQSKLPPTPLLGRKVFPDTTDYSIRPSPLSYQTIYENSEPKPDQKDTLPIPDGSQQEFRRIREKGETRVGYVRTEIKPERLQPKMDHVEAKVSEKALPVQDGQRTEKSEIKASQGMASLTVEKVESKGNRHTERRRERHERKLERQESSEQEMPKQELERRRDRHEKRLERQGSSEQETPKQEQSERRRDRHERRTERQEINEQIIQGLILKSRGATLADIVEQLQEKEALQNSQGSRDSPARLPKG